MFIKPINSTFAVFLLYVALSGCSAFQKDHNVGVVGLSEHPRPLVVTYDATSRGTYVTNSKPDIRICAEPAPDAAVESLLKLSGTLSAATSPDKTTSAEANAEIQSKIIELAGRTQLVLLARETLYRACEHSLNNPDNPTTVDPMFEAVLDLIVKLGTATTTQADAAKVQAEAAKKQADANNIKATTEAAKTANTLHPDSKKILEDYLKTLGD